MIDCIFARSDQSRAVLQGLDTEHLQRIHNWHQTEQADRIAFPFQLVEERSPFNIYLIEWEDGSGYVGMTGQSIMARMARHFDQIHLGDANYEFLRRYEVGIGYRFHCLHTDLDRRAAEALEVQEIKNRTNLLNLAHNQNLLRRKSQTLWRVRKW